MVAQATLRKFTYADYLIAPDDARYELLDGELIMSPSPNIPHQDSLFDLGVDLKLLTRRTRIGRVFIAPVDVVLSDTDVVQPDLVFVSRERSHIITVRNIRGAPDLVVEILSPSTAERDRIFKRSLYAIHGVKEYWMVDTELRLIHQLLLDGDDFRLAGVFGMGDTLVHAERTRAERVRRVHGVESARRREIQPKGNPKMVAQETLRKFTYADYLIAPDDARYELLDGELIMSPSPNRLHQSVSLNLSIDLGFLARRAAIGYIFAAPFDVVLSDTNVVQPDIMFVSNARAHIITDDNIRGAPDLVVEILSTGTAERDRTFKRDLYARHGVKEYWMVDTDLRLIHQLLLDGDDFRLAGVFGMGDTLVSPTLNGHALNVSDVFAE